MTSLFETVAAFFRDDDWPIQMLEGTTGLRTAFQGESGQWICQAWVREQAEQFIFYSVCPITAPEERRAAVAEFITRANYGMLVGNFEMDYTDGEVRYKTSVDVEGSQLSQALCRQIVVANVMMMDRYLPGILSVVSNAQTPAQAIANIEGH